MAVNPALRYFLGAVLAVIVGYLVDLYLPLQPASHVLAIICYIAAAILVLLGVFALIRGPGV